MSRHNNEEQQEERLLFRHFSHEHPLELACNDSSRPEADRVHCVGCGIHILPRKAYYTCRTCDFSLHRPCYNMPRKVHHPGDPAHDLVLHLSTSFACKGCGNPGSGCFYHCGICLQSYHILCSVLPLSTSHYSHPHVLKLEFSPPNYDGVEGFSCDICKNPGSDHWLYRCGTCEFDIHLHCAMSLTAKTLNPRFRKPTKAASDQAKMEWPYLIQGASSGSLSLNITFNLVF